MAHDATDSNVAQNPYNGPLSFYRGSNACQNLKKFVTASYSHPILKSAERLSLYKKQNNAASDSHFL